METVPAPLVANTFLSNYMDYMVDLVDIVVPLLNPHFQLHFPGFYGHPRMNPHQRTHWGPQLHPFHTKSWLKSLKERFFELTRDSEVCTGLHTLICSGTVDHLWTHCSIELDGRSTL